MNSASITTVPTGRPAWSRAVRVGFYDGALDKEDTKTEPIPYAWIWYNEYTGALGTAFSQDTTGSVHSRKLALARLAAAIQRGAEKINANSHPDTADDMLGEWMNVLAVRASGDEVRQEIRQRAAAKFLATKGATRGNVDYVCSRLLGLYFVGNVRVEGVDLANPPDPTYWSPLNPGPSTFSLGRPGAWFSIRSKLAVSVSEPADLNDTAFQKLVNVELFNELDRDLPAWMTFNWSVGVATTGFLLDISHMDFSGLT